MDAYVEIRNRYVVLSDGCLCYLMAVVGHYGVEMVGLDIIQNYTKLRVPTQPESYLLHNYVFKGIIEMISNRKLINKSQNIQNNESFLKMVEEMWKTNVRNMEVSQKIDNEKSIGLEDIYDGDKFAINMLKIRMSLMDDKDNDAMEILESMFQERLIIKTK